MIASNRRARHDYTILDTYEAGIALAGTEVKSLRLGRASLADAFAIVDGGEVWLHGLHIAEYAYGSWTNHAPRRTRKLLLHRKEIDKIAGRIADSGLTLVPMALYFANGYVKVELALAKGKRTWDKRQAIAKRDAERQMARGIGWQLKGRA
ncbi:SsrA-binding protein [Herbihabitans rhizosphaerae]|uniref:SsrA-binding protein n=1 Tax=Herbihabitans rhizosphaerae TaxID=1872711 RepID=A0A4V2EU51_9PSEU|nr:SsrA-binding protein SmpB [Herbihabitans rhizosphaerae]RZS43353.1 SsrA-binding protein [Herbihabitans rhizosphaerae]